ncbi:MAG: M14 family zinc carboxypeptidase [Cyanobacteria bacterium P01_H01_bin.21]
MEWNDLTRLDSVILETKALGACVEEIGVSAEGRTLYGITLGSQAPTVVIVAGFHADEVIGPLTAISVLQRLLKQPVSNIRLGIVPVADPDFLNQNASELPTAITLRDLLKLNHCRDLEGNFTADLYPECTAIRRWMQGFNRVDAYFSLHSAGLISPGLFFYIGGDPRCVDQAVTSVAAAVPDHIPLLSHDPTGLSQTVLSPGFFELTIPDIQTSPGNSLSFISHHFQPQFVGVSEMPLAVCHALANASLAKIDQYNRRFKQTGESTHPFQEISLESQLSILQAWIMSVIHYVATEGR